MRGPAVSPGRYTAFFILVCGILDAGLAGLNFGHHLFVPVAPSDSAFLYPPAASADGQAAFCFQAAGRGVTPARLALRFIDV